MKKILPALSGIAMFLIYTIVMVLIIRIFNWNFIIGFIFSILAMAATGLVTIMITNNKSGTDYSFYGIHIIILSALYLILTFAVNLRCVLIHYNVFAEIAFDLILIIGYIMGIAFIVSARQHTEAIDRHDHQKNQFIKWLEFTVKSAQDQTADGEIQKRLEKLAQEIHYQDPQSNYNLQPIENRLEDTANNLLETARSRQMEKEEVFRMCDEMTRLLSERRRLVLMGK